MKRIILALFLTVITFSSCRHIEVKPPVLDVGDVIEGTENPSSEHADLVVDLVDACYDNKEKRIVPKPIYGIDDRYDCEEMPKDFLHLAKTSVALINKNSLLWDEGAGVYRIKYPVSYGRAYQLCEGERFYDQPSLAFCSGSHLAIANDKSHSLVMTAGHCLKTLADCKSTYFVLGFTKKDRLEDYTFAKTQVFECKDLKVSTLDDEASKDYAVAATDRLMNIPTVAISSAQTAIGDSVLLIGYPNGLPMKATTNGRVAAVMPTYFTATTDSFGGNSGSPAFSMSSQKQVGILVRGHTDHVWVESKRKEISYKSPLGIILKDYMIVEEKGTQCRRENKVDENFYFGEHIQNLNFMSEYFPSLVKRVFKETKVGTMKNSHGVEVPDGKTCSD